MRLSTQHVAAIITAIGVGGLFLVISWRGGMPKGLQRKEMKAEDVVFALFEAMRNGDVRAYMNCLGGEAYERMARALREMGDKNFRAYLKRMHSEVKGVATSEDQRISRNELILRVEIVFEERNEVQRYRLRRIGGQWKIIRMGASQYIKPPIPYGTPVQEL